MSSERKKYTEDYKKRAVALSYSSGRPLRDTAASMGISVSSLHRWRSIYTEAGEYTEDAKDNEDKRCLRAQIAELEREVDLLKKASAYFAKHQS